MYIKGETDGLFESNDYIEFYAKGNDGWLDSLVYDDSNHIGNPYSSLVNDTITYYLTWNNSTGNRRYQVESDVNFGNYNASTYCFAEETVSYNDDYFLGFRDENVSSPFYTQAEGWGSFRFNKGGAKNTILSLDNIYMGLGAPDALCSSVTFSVNNANSTNPFIGNHHLRVSYGNSNIVFDSIYLGYKRTHQEFNIPNNELSTSQIITHRSIDDLGAVEDQHSVAYIHIEYPHTFNFDGRSKMFFKLPINSSQNKSFIDISNLTGTGAIMYTLEEEPRKIPVVNVSGNQWAIIPNLGSANSNSCFVMDSNAVQNISSLIPVNQTGAFTNFSLLNVDSAYLMITHKTLWSEAQTYENHRALEYNTLLVDIDELYDQFGGGIEKNGFAIRRFSRLIYDQWSTTPKSLFLIGKSVKNTPNSGQPNARKDFLGFAKCLVPSFGNPQSDMLYTSGIGPSDYAPAFPVGRISVNNPVELNEYYQKVIEYENQQSFGNNNRYWMKNILHFGGGGNPQEQVNFAGYLNGFKNIAENLMFGANVSSFFKGDFNSAISVDLNDSIADLISEGVSMMTFFGHGTSTGFDQNIDSVENYSWNNKYPVVMGNSCFSGDIHLYSSNSASESFVLKPSLGAIAFVASSGLGIERDLNDYCKEVYTSISQYNYGGTMGEHLVNSCLWIENNSNSGSFSKQNIVLIQTLHGDPALRVNYNELPDYFATPSDIQFQPSIVTAEVDSFNVNITISNQGKAIYDTVIVELVRTYPDGVTTETYYQNLVNDFYQKIVSFTLPVNPFEATGINNISVHVDYLDSTQEVSEMNNIINRNLQITSGGLIPVYPYNYAIVPKNQVTLKASTGNPLAAEEIYRFEVDTNDLFLNSISTTVTQTGGVVKWELPFALTDSTVYFWRVSKDSLTSADVFEWRESSFQYIEGQRGWGQAHFHQFKNDGLSAVDYQRSTREFKFLSGIRKISATVIGNPTNGTDFAACSYYIDNAWVEGNLCTLAPSIYVAVLDSITLEPWTSYCPTHPESNPNHQFNNRNNNCGCRARAEKYFVFRQNNASEMAGLENMLNDSIPNGNYVLVYTVSADYNTWTAVNPNLISAFSNLGATTIGSGPQNTPFMLFTKKGNSTPIFEQHGTSLTEAISFTADLTFFGNSGSITSVPIGPSTSWNKLFWEHDHLFNNEPDTNDITRVLVYGMESINSSPNLLTDTLMIRNDSLDLSGIIDASVYPFMQLKANFVDEYTTTPAQIDKWQVLYQDIPEAALNTSLGVVFYNDSLAEGDSLKFAIAIENISDLDMDSLLVHYWIEDQYGQYHYINYDRQDSIKSGEILKDTIAVSTTGYLGGNKIWIEANPFVTALGDYDQLEQFHFNNIAQKAFYVSADNINPILDVTFDGYHIMDEELVSAQPNIVITLKDENQFFVLNEDADTSNFKVYLIEPGSTFQQPIHFMDGSGNQIMRWTSANGPNDKFSIEYLPKLLKDGIYELIVFATDKSGNESGDVEYRIKFQVENQLTVTEVLNYPNPFSTRTQFVFKLTGVSPPDYMKIQIMTISGKVVREITQDELGPLRIGINRTDYWWDGRDEFGDLLAKGIYLYRVITRNNNEEVELRETEATKYFTKGFGKMYLMR